MIPQMPNPDIESKIKELLARKLDRKVEDIRGDSRLAEDLGVDSFGTVELMFEIEEAFGLQIPDTDIEPVRTVNDIVVYLQGYLDQQPKR
jgi:acyl carrier protein